MDWSNCSQNGIATFDCIGPLLQTIISWLLVLAGIVALFLIIYAGIRFITSGGEAKQVESARKILTYAIIGLIIVLSSFFIINFIADFTGVSCIKVFGFSSCGTGSSGQSGGGSGGISVNCPYSCIAKNLCGTANDLVFVPGYSCYSGTVCCKDMTTAPTAPGCASPNYCYPTDFCNSGNNRTAVSGYSCYSGATCCRDGTSAVDNCPSGSSCMGKNVCISANDLQPAGSGTCAVSTNICCKAVAAAPPPPPAYITCPSTDGCMAASRCTSLGGHRDSSHSSACASGQYCCAGL